MDKKNKKETKNDNKSIIKDSRLYIRTNKYTKEYLKKMAKKHNLSVTDYVLECALYGKKESNHKLAIIQCLATLEEIGNHIRNTYGTKDYYIERVLDELWEKLL